MSPTSRSSEVVVPFPSSAAPLAVEVIDRAEGFDALARDWDALLARCDATVFQSFEWQRTWWRHFGENRPGARLCIVTVRDVTVRDRRGLVAVAPLHVDRARTLGALPLRRMLFVGHRDADYLDVLAEPGRERECARLIAEQLAERRDRFDALVLEDVPDRSRVAPLLREALARHGFWASQAPCEVCPRTALRPTWEETLAGFRSRIRADIRRRARRLATGHRFELEVVRDGEEVAPALRELVELHQARWARDGHAGVFADARQLPFQLEAAEALGRRGWLFLAFLRVDGRRSAAVHGFVFRDTAAVYLTGVRPDEALAGESPGRVLHALCMEWAVTAGCRVYDFMRGAERYKHEAFDAVDVPNWRLVAYPRAPLLARVRLRLHAVAEKVWRRAWREAYALRRTVREEGWRSRHVRAHVARAARRGWDDLRRILGAPRAPRPR